MEIFQQNYISETMISMAFTLWSLYPTSSWLVLWIRFRSKLIIEEFSFVYLGILNSNFKSIYDFVRNRYLPVIYFKSNSCVIAFQLLTNEPHPLNTAHTKLLHWMAADRYRVKEYSTRLQGICQERSIHLHGNRSTKADK